MAFEDINEHAKDFKEHAQSYIEHSVSYYKLWGLKVTAKLSSSMVQLALLLFFMGMVLLFGSIAGALTLSAYLNNTALGFLLVAAFYLVILLILMLFKGGIIERPLLRKLSRIFYND